MLGLNVSHLITICPSVLFWKVFFHLSVGFPNDSGNPGFFPLFLQVTCNCFTISNGEMQDVGVGLYPRYCGHCFIHRQNLCQFLILFSKVVVRTIKAAGNMSK